MTTTDNIRLLPVETPTPQSGFIPLKHARYWCSDKQQAHPRLPGTAVFLTQKAYVRANVHAQSDPENEVGGWLIGNWRKDHQTGEEYIVIERCLPALYTRHGSAFLTFTQDSQVAMFDIMEDHFPDKELVGWYHTHPKMSIFLSNYDLFLHKYFFPNPWQVALVIEPHSHQAGFFIRDQEGNLDGKHYFGFYELPGKENRSVVRWTNMQNNLTESPGVMDYEDE